MARLWHGQRFSAQRGKPKREQIKPHAHERRNPGKKRAVDHHADPGTRVWIGEQLGAHTVGHSLMPHRRRAAKHARQEGRIQSAACMGDAARPL